MNRSTIYEYLDKDTDLKFSFTYQNNRKYMIFIMPYKWEHSFLLINSMRVTDFQSLILYSNELVVRFSKYDDWQINIPYKDIEYFEVREDMDIKYMGLHKDKKVYH